MKLLTEGILQQLPKLGSTDEEVDPLLVCKLVTPDGQWTWYVIEFDGVDLFYGYVVAMFSEFGTFRLSELEHVRDSLELPVVREVWFEPCRLSTILKNR